ncbi:hypothetical protein [Rathayibacter sp. VKM Ac-2630]|uniref:hypothetical protein n=1 Tax=Rathayibacter sp. VKM Ac-2630 TaxID=1938617 RepID=UPI0009810850|nr:hypothetical protein [Rathayibacter sp. VKM Ac-2630]OOB90715.1 hypothetical protein B0T42_09920 [Rathayibacter sp. VKM Ac-2630]
MSTTKKITLAGKFPGEEQNGMTALESDWSRVESPNGVYVIARVERTDLSIKEDGSRVAKAGLKQVELVPLEDEEKVLSLLREYCGARGGFMAAAPDVQLDLDIEGGDDE